MPEHLTTALEAGRAEGRADDGAQWSMSDSPICGGRVDEFL